VPKSQTLAESNFYFVTDLINAFWNVN